MKLLDSGTSIGANIEEGRAGQTKPDFIAKNFISLKESRETRFWLRVIEATDPPLQKELQPFLQESNEFIAMLTTSLKTLAYRSREVPTICDDQRRALLRFLRSALYSFFVLRCSFFVLRYASFVDPLF